MYYLFLGLFITSIGFVLFSLIYVPSLNWKVREEKMSVKRAVQKSFTTYFIAFGMMLFTSALSSAVQSSNTSVLDWIELFFLIMFTSFIFAGAFTWIFYNRLMRWLKIKSLKIVR